MLQGFISLLFPPFCASCDQIGCWLCWRHLNSLTWNYAPPVDGWIYNALEYRDSAQDIVKAVKYGRYYRYAQLMAQLTALRFPDFALQHDIQALIAVPLHPKKRKWRGYNQAELYAKHLGKYWQVPVLTDVLIREKHSQSQASQNREERAKISHSFRAVRPLLLTKVCLIDDVATTGSTLRACAEALGGEGKLEVVAVTFAREQ